MAQSGDAEVRPPDKKLTQFAFMMAIMEKAISTLGTMNFIWATVVLLGGFAQSLESIDFWFVSIILVVEGLRISCRSGELATQAATCRSCSRDLILTSIYVYSLVIQELSAFACIGLSTFRIVKQQYGSGDNLNLNRALSIFYWLSLLESSLTLLGCGIRSFFLQWPIRLGDTFISKRREMSFSLVVGKVWKSGLKEYGIDDSQFDTVRRFLYQSYCRCINGNVFDGLKMDFVSYSVELLRSTDYNDQLMGARLLYTLANNVRFAAETLKAIGTMRDTVEKLIEMLNWDKPDEQEIRRAVAEIICKLVEIPRNRIRVMAIPEFMESISSLLYDSNQNSHSSDVGLRILKTLANDPDNCAKIGTNHELVCKIIKLTNLNPGESLSVILTHLKSLSIETPGPDRQPDVGDNIDDNNLKSDSIDQV